MAEGAWNLSPEAVPHLPEAAQKEFRRLFTAREEEWLDSGRGCCVLRDSKCRQHVSETLHSFDGVRYSLDHWVIMPNHVHLMMQPKDGWSVGDIAASWKKFSARRINALRKQTGNLWQTETFDHIVRDRDQLDRIRRYIEGNPGKARLRDGEYALGRGTGVI